jgi:hypothetical protein
VHFNLFLNEASFFGGTAAWLASLFDFGHLALLYYFVRVDVCLVDAVAFNALRAMVRLGAHEGLMH